MGKSIDMLPPVSLIEFPVSALSTDVALLGLELINESAWFVSGPQIALFNFHRSFSFPDCKASKTQT